MKAQEKKRMDAVQLPPELTGHLRKMIRRVRRIILLRGLLVTVSVLVISALAIMAVDAAVLIYSSSVRWTLSAVGLAATLATAWNSLVRPLTRRLTLFRMARVLETRHPELQERISSAIELLSMGGAAASRGSGQLIELLVRDAKSDVKGVQLRREFTGRSLKPAFLATLVAGGMLALLFAVWPRQAGLLFMRAVAPYADFASLQGSGLIVEPGDAVRLQGEELFIRLRVKKGDGARAEVRRVIGEGREAAERMRRTSAPGATEEIYELSFPSVTETFRYRLRYGNGLTRYYEVVVLPPPATTRLAITCHFPEYTKQPSRTLSDNDRSIVGIAGTRVEMDADFNREADAMLQLGGRRLPGLAKKTPGATWHFVLATNMTDRWSLLLHDSHGFTGCVEEASLKVVPDRAPAILMLSPHMEQLTLPPYGQVTFEWAISEDFGITRSDFCIAYNKGTVAFANATALAMQKQGPEAWIVTRDLDLARMQMDGVRQFRVFLRVADTLPPELGGPQRVQSRVVQITIDASAKRIEDQLRDEQKKYLQGLLKAAAARLTQGAGLVEPVQAQTSVNPLKPEVLQALVSAQERAVTAMELVQKAAEACERSYFATLAPIIKEAATQAIDPARAAVAEILFAEAAQRPAKSGVAVKSLRDAAAKVLALVAAIDDLDRKLAAIAKTAELAQREKALAEQAGDKKMTQAELDAWKKEQEKIKQEFAAQAQKNAAESNAVENAMSSADAAQKAMNKDHPTAKDDQAQRAARAAEESAKLAADAAEKAKDAALHAEDFAKERDAAMATAEAADQAEKAAKEAEKAADDAHQATENMAAAERAAEAQAREEAAKAAKDAAIEAHKAAEEALKAATLSEKSATEQNQGKPVDAKQDADAADKKAQDATQSAKQAQASSEQAAEQAKAHNADKAESAAQEAKDAAQMANRAAELSKEAGEQSRAAEKRDAEQRQSQTQQAQDKARQAQEMAKEAMAKADDAAKKAGEQDAEAQQAEKTANQESGTPEQIEAAAKHAGQEAAQAAKDAKAAAEESQKAVAKAHDEHDPVMQAAAEQSEEASKMADQAADLAAQSEQQIEKTEESNPSPSDKQKSRQQAAEKAAEAAQLARDAADMAQHAAEAAKEKLQSDASQSEQSAKEAAHEAEQAAQESQAAEKSAHAAQSEPAEEAAQTGQKAAEMAKEAAQETVQAMQSAHQNSEASDQKAEAQAKLAAEKAAEAAKLAQQAEAEAHQAEASSENAQEAAHEAQSASEKMSEMAQHQAKAAGEKTSSPHEWRSDESTSASESKQHNDTMNMGRRDFLPVFLRNLEFPGASWMRSKKRANSEAFEGVLKNVPPEYRDLVRKYFEELSREGGKDMEVAP